MGDQGHQGGQEEAEGGHDQGNQRFVCEKHNHTYISAMNIGQTTVNERSICLSVVSVAYEFV